MGVLWYEGVVIISPLQKPGFFVYCDLHLWHNFILGGAVVKQLFLAEKFGVPLSILQKYKLANVSGFLFVFLANLTSVVLCASKCYVNIEQNILHL